MSDKEIYLKLGEMESTIRHLEKCHVDYMNDVEKNDIFREQIKDLIEDLGSKFQSFSTTQDEIKQTLKEQSIQIVEINQKDRTRVTVFAVVGSLLAAIGAFAWSFIDPIIQFISFYYHKTAVK